MKNMSNRKKTRAFAKKLIISLIVWGFGILMMLPFLWMVSASFKTIQTVFAFPIEWFPKDPVLNGYKAILLRKVPFYTYIKNTSVVVIMGLIGTYINSVMSGYAFAKMKFAGRDKIFLLKLASTMLPGLVSLVPTYFLYSKIGLLNSLLGLWLPWFLGGNMATFMMRQAFMAIPDSMIEAARIDGANHFKVCWKVAAPNVKPSISSVMFLYFLWIWNEYERPMLFIIDEAKKTLPVAVKFFSDGEFSNYPAIMAANVLLILPILILFLLMQKSFVESLLSSSVKG